MEELLRLCDQLDHAGVGLLGGGTERKNAMVEQNHPNCLRACLGRKELSTETGQLKARHDIGDHHHTLAVQKTDTLGTVYTVGEGDDRIGVGMVYILVGEQGMQNRFDRRRRRRGVDQAGAQRIGHLRV